TSSFFAPNNNFFYLEGEGPLVLPDGVYEPERVVGKVTGNNAATWSPSRNDWYETVKLNYGYDFRYGYQMDFVGIRPDTWNKMNEIIAYWQELGVDGFRCDMAHMVPVPFWEWLIQSARQRDEGVYFLGEAYDGDPMKVTTCSVTHALIEAGFDSVYDSESYDLVKAIFEGDMWANDLENLQWDEMRHDKMLKYVENHDEVRVASLSHWGGMGASAGKAAFATLALMSKAPVMLYNGQEVAEPARGAEGFAQDNGKSTIFDYWSQPELTKKNSTPPKIDQYQLRLMEDYTALLHLIKSDFFKHGSFYGLNHMNRLNPTFGRAPEDACSGRFLFAFIREYKGDKLTVVINFSADQTFEDVRVTLPRQNKHSIRKENNVVLIKKIAPFSVILSGNKTFFEI
ncbi:alpha-amylase family glycosyl hydrolase, partial [Akkermansiaceae bacterium]|nr:alpha-amylase family glycosyl hydrolase [Akkermansiaceae bacterium]